MSAADLCNALSPIAPGVCGLFGVPARNSQDVRTRSRRPTEQLRCDRIALRGGQAPRGGPNAGCGSHCPSPAGLMWDADAGGSRTGAGDQRVETTRDHGAGDLIDQAAARGAGPSQGTRESGPESRRASCGAYPEPKKPVKSCSNRQSINELWISIWAASGAPAGPLCHGKCWATGHERSGFDMRNPKTGQRLKADLDSLLLSNVLTVAVFRSGNTPKMTVSVSIRPVMMATKS